MDTVRDKFLDTQRIPFTNRKSKLSNQNNLIVQGASNGSMSFEGSDAKMFHKAEKDAFLDFSRTGQSNLGIKLDPDMVQTKTSIKIKEIDFG